MAAIFEKFGLRLPYPENWQVEDGINPHWPESLTIQSPDGAFWSLSIHPEATDVAQLTAVVLAAMREEYDEVETEAVEESLLDTDLQGFNLNFYCLDLVIQAQLRAFAAHGRKFVVLSQGEDRDFDRNRMVFEALTRAVVDRQLADRVAQFADGEAG